MTQIKNPTIKTLVKKLDEELESLQQETNIDQFKLTNLNQKHHNHSTIAIIILGILSLLTLVGNLQNWTIINIISSGTSSLLVIWWTYNTINYTLKTKESDSKLLALADLKTRINNLKILASESKENDQN